MPGAHRDKVFGRPVGGEELNPTFWCARRLSHRIGRPYHFPGSNQGFLGRQPQPPPVAAEVRETHFHELTATISPLSWPAGPPKRFRVPQGPATAHREVASCLMSAPRRQAARRPPSGFISDRPADSRRRLSAGGRYAPAAGRARKVLDGVERRPRTMPDEVPPPIAGERAGWYLVAATVGGGGADLDTLAARELCHLV